MIIWTGGEKDQQAEIWLVLLHLSPLRFYNANQTGSDPDADG